MHIGIAVLACAISGTSAYAATLEKLSLEQMSDKATLIVRGKVTGCTGESKGSLIYTRCRISVIERWKGSSAAQVEFVVPGGTARGLTQTFTGTPRFQTGDEHVLFLWAGRSGTNQVIGLSQGAFGLKQDNKGQPVVTRAASAEVMVNSQGGRIQDEPVEMNLTVLRGRVRQALESGAAK